MNKATSYRLPHPRNAVRAAAMNAGLLLLLAGVFLWSVAGNAIENLRGLIGR